MTTFSINENEGSILYETGNKQNKIDTDRGEGAFYVPKEVINETSKFQIAFRKVQKEHHSSQEERLFGIYFHTLIGAIENASQIQDKLEMLIKQGLVDSSSRKKIEETARVFFNEGKAIGLFDGISKVLNERSILLPSGKLLIPDKVMVRENDVVVLDFKTGKKESKHEKQVRNYKKNLEGIFNQKVIPMLYYTKSNEFIQV
jgi:hypothetical protein